MADITRIDKITKTDKAAAKEPAYSDFFTNFNRHPETGALVRNVDANSVKRRLRNLILTNKGERMFRPSLGTDLQQLMFENMSEVTENMIKTYIEDAIAAYESRSVRVIQTVVKGNELLNQYDVAIVFEIINSTVPVTLNLTISRVR